MNLTIILTTLLLFVIILLIWNTVNFHSLKKQSSRHNEQLNDSKYFELKYKQEFFVAIVSFIVGFTAFIGYSSLESVESKLKSELDNRVKDKLDSIANKIRIQDSTIDNLTKVSRQLEHITTASAIKQQQISRLLAVSELKAKTFSDRIYELNQKNILKQEFYIVQGVEYDLNTITERKPYVRYYFKDLRTILNEPLPTFKKPPAVIVSATSADFWVTRVTTEAVELTANSYIDTIGKIVPLNLIIAELP